MKEETSNEIEIANHFKYFFKTLVAVDDVVRNQIYGVRHRVYSEERGYEGARSNVIEKDEFDVQSHFAAVQHKSSKELAGCIRVVNANNNELLPLEKHYGFVLNHPELHPSKFDRDTICEISQIALLKIFKRRKEDHNDSAETDITNQQYFCKTERRCFPFIAITLYMTACAMAHIQGKSNAFIMAEPSLILCTNLIGLNFEQVGNFVDFHGQRAPFYISYEKFITELNPQFIKMYLDIEKKVAVEFKKANLLSRSINRARLL